jgi:exopolysaccharide biosynthesis polyprenyl glycosylphosphotransferase
MEAHTHPIPQLEQTLLRPERRGSALAASKPSGATAADTRDRVYRHVLACADVVSAIVALTLCVTLIGDDRLRLGTFLALPLIVLAAKLQGLYDRDELLIRKTTLDEAPQIFQLATTGTLVFWLLDGQLVAGTLGDTQVLVLWTALFGSAMLARRCARTVLSRVAPTERLLFIGDARAYDRLKAKLGYEDTNAELVGRMSLQRVSRRGERATQAGDLHELLDWTGAHRVVIDPEVLQREDMLDLVRAAKDAGVRVSLLPHVLDVVGTAVVFDELHGMTLLGVRSARLSRSSRMVKRSFDLVGGVLGLLAISPFLLAIAVAVRLDSRGPVFFRQTRIGRDGRPFRIWKFRTMCVDAEARKAALRASNEVDGGLFKITHDPRVTRVGRLLRKTSLDELPQLLNVVAGDMSLVGPRPLVVDEDERITGWDRHRLYLTPGMTGRWQLLGSTRVPLPEMVKLDYLYVVNWSLWADVKILVRTVAVVLGRRGC